MPPLVTAIFRFVLALAISVDVLASRPAGADQGHDDAQVRSPREGKDRAVDVFFRGDAAGAEYRGCAAIAKLWVDFPGRNKSDSGSAYALQREPTHPMPTDQCVYTTSRYTVIRSLPSSQR